DADKSRKLSAGMAHSILGYAYIKQDKTAAAIPELRAAAGLLKGQDDQQYSIALYRLGFAYAKLNRVNDAREVLTEAVKISGPAQNMSQDLLAKVNAARAKGKGGCTTNFVETGSNGPRGSGSRVGTGSRLNH